jgi:hypothetical protein
MKIHQNSRQGTAGHTEVHRANHASRGSYSPLKPQYGTAQPDGLIRRDEDFASAQMERHKTKGVPEPNNRGGVTAVRGKHSPQMNEDVS